MSASATDWAAWHDPYGDSASAPSRRLEVVQNQIRRALPPRSQTPFRVLGAVRRPWRRPDRGAQLYGGAVPAGLVLLCGVLGNISDDDARTTVMAMPELCQTGGTVVWTRNRRAPDRTPQIRRWFAEAGFAEVAFIAPEDELFSVSACRFLGEPQPLGSTRQFRFIR